ncbi:MAG: NCS2 family permease [Zoogloeaceae bacterium]|jgi:AGZA family xanthine/uracil permease-like MFS transporter|nr:NCS2 family permease [Zoogloeaceae bacterium]
MRFSSAFLDKFFHITENGSSVRTEALAGATTFLTMCYIIAFNPALLAKAGMDVETVFVATCLVAALGSILMGILTNYPVAQAPGMGVNTYFALVVCVGMGVDWRIALAATFVSGCLLLLLSALKLRDNIIHGIPFSLQISIGIGIGLFLARIALENAGVSFSETETSTGLGDLHSPQTWLVICGFILILVMHIFRISGAIIASILLVTLLSGMLGLNEIHGVAAMPPAFSPVLTELDFGSLLSVEMIGIIFTFCLITLFDTTGTMVGVTNHARLLKDEKLRNLKGMLVANSTTIIAGGALGTSPSVAYIESAAGVSAGGRTGLTAVVVGCLFLVSLLFMPLLHYIPHYATTPALLYVAMLMMQELNKIDWQDIAETIPAFLTMVTMPFTHSIANGIAIGFISFVVVKCLMGSARQISGVVWVVSSLWMLHIYWGP